MRSSCSRCCCLLACVALSAALAATVPALFLATPRAEATDDPLAVRRVLIPPERVPAELERVRQGVLVQLSRAEFEQRLQRARQTRAAVHNPPRLIEAHYRATLMDTALVGTGRWGIVHAASGTGMLALQPLNLALRKARLLKAPFDTTDAILGDLDGKTLGLLVERTGDNTAFIDWTARGSSAPGTLRFDLRVPACAVATLELNLPADRIVSPRDVFLLTGPLPAEAADRRLWRIDFAGQSLLDLEIRQNAAPNQATPLVLATLSCRQEIEPDLVRADFDFELEVPHQGVRNFVFSCDPELRPYDVTVRHLETWETRAAANPTHPGIVTIKLREPYRDTSQPLQIQVRCLAPLQSDKTWTSPSMRLVGALAQGETLLLRVHPGVRLENWQPGSFLLTSLSDVEAGKPAAEGWQVLNLASSGLHGTSSARPSARIRTQMRDFRARMLAWWQIGAHAMNFTAHVTYEVTEGQLYRLPLTLPTGWDVDRVELTPADWQHSWSVVQENDRPTLAVELHKPLVPATPSRPAPPLRLTVKLRPVQRWAMPAGVTLLPFPDLVPVGAHLREGILGVSVDPLFQVNLQATVAAGGGEDKGPWDSKLPDYLFPYRGLPVAGLVRLQPRRAHVRAHAASDVLLTPEGATLVSRLLLEPRIGNPEVIEVRLSAPSTGQWNWKTERGHNQVQSVQRLRALDDLPRLGCLVGQPLTAAVRFAQPGLPGEWWRLTLAKPLREPLLLRATLPFPVVRAQESGLSWEVPLPSIHAAEPMDGEVTLHLERVDTLAFAAQGPWETPTGSRPHNTLWRTYRYGRTPARLSVHGRRAAETPAAALTGEPRVDAAQLTTTVAPPGRLLHHFRFQVSNWRQQSLPVRLPHGACCLAAKADGRWIPTRPRPQDQVIVEVPVSPRKSAHSFEIIYERLVPAWKIWSTFEAPAPELPVQPISFQRVWRLPPGLTPVHAERFQPGRERTVLTPQQPGITDDGWRFRTPTTLLHAALGIPADDGVVRQRLAFADALASLHHQDLDRSSWTLADALEYVVADFLKGKENLVLDVGALQEAALTPATPLPRLTTESARSLGLGLVVVPCRPAALLTTNRQLQRWQLPAETPLDGPLTQAIAEAAQQGHDSSGRFHCLANWLRDFSVRRSAATTDPASDPGTLEAGWTDWLPNAAPNDDALLSVVRQDMIASAGLAITTFLAWLLWRSRRWRRRLRLGTLAACLGAGALALVWLPITLRGLAWYPTLLTGAVALIGYVCSLSLSSRREPRALSSMAILLALAFVPLVPGQAVAPFTVFLLPGPDNAPDQQSALVPPEFLKQLQALTSRGVPGLRNAVLLSAQYAGSVTPGGGDFTADFRVHSFSEKPTTLMLPLGGVQLRAPALLDGVQTHPRALDPQGYSLEISGRGAHVISLRFTVPITTTGEDRDLHFDIPEVLQSRLTLDLPAGAHFVSTVTGRGRQAVTPELAQSAAADKPLHLEADLGRTASAQVRWRHDAHTTPAASVQLREAYLWKLHPAASTLLAILQYRVKHGVATTFTVELPETLEVRAVEASRIPGTPAGDVVPRLKDWRLVGAGQTRRLQFEFQRPVTGGVQLWVELVPRQTFGASAVLPLPVPLQVHTTEGLLAFQVEGYRAQVAEHLRINGMDPRGFSKAWRAAGMNDPGPDTHAYAFQRGPFGIPYLRLTLRMPASDAVCRQKIDWLIGTRQAEVAVSARITAPGKDLMLVDWDVPESLQGLVLSGADLHYWSRTGNRLQVWLQKPLGDTELKLTGWQPLEMPNSPPSTYAVFRFAPLGVASARARNTYIQLKTAGDLVLIPETLKNLGPLPDTRFSGRECNYVTDQADIGGIVRVRPRHPQVDVRMLTLADRVDHKLSFTSTLDYQVRQGELRTLTVKLRNGGSAEVQLVAPGVSRQREQLRDLGERVWTLTLPEGVAGTYRLKLIGTMSLDATTGTAMPDVRVEGARVREHWLAVVGRELRAEAPRGLTAVSNPPWQGSWPVEAIRIHRAGSAWRVQADDWQLRLFPRLTEAAPFRLLLSEQSAAVVDGRRWLHQADYWLYHDSGADLNIVLPDNARLLTLAVDGTEVAPVLPRPGRLGLPFTGAGARTVRLSWVFDDARESLDQPNSTPPVLEGLANARTLWTFHVPTGYRAAFPQGPADSLAFQDYHRAEALFQLSTLLAERLRGRLEGPLASQLADTQEFFYRYCRQALLHTPTDDLSQRISELKERNRRRASMHGFDESRTRAERQALLLTPNEQERRSAFARDDIAPARGTPLYLQADDVPVVHLEALQQQQERRALEATFLFLALVLGAGVLAFFPKLLAWTRCFWPEQMVLLSYLLARAWGPGWFVLFLLLFGILGRTLLVGQWALALLRRLTHAVVRV